MIGAAVAVNNLQQQVLRNSQQLLFRQMNDNLNRTRNTDSDNNRRRQEQEDKESSKYFKFDEEEMNIEFVKIEGVWRDYMWKKDGIDIKSIETIPTRSIKSLTQITTGNFETYYGVHIYDMRNTLCITKEEYDRLNELLLNKENKDD